MKETNLGNPAASKPRSKPRPSGYPSEAAEQMRLVKWLSERGYLFTATANGADMSPAQRMKMGRTGVSPGVPDILIFENDRGYKGIAIELKRARGGKATSEQERWLQALSDRGWIAFVANGAEEAIVKLQQVYDNGGYA
jgi:hypothetical protein